MNRFYVTYSIKGGMYVDASSYGDAINTITDMAEDELFDSLDLCTLDIIDAEEQ